MRDASEHRQPVSGQRLHDGAKSFGPESKDRKPSGTSSDEQAQRTSPYFPRKPTEDVDIRADDKCCPASPCESIDSNRIRQYQNADRLRNDRMSTSPVARRASIGGPMRGMFDAIEVLPTGTGREEETPTKSHYCLFKGIMKEDESPEPMYAEPFLRKLDSATSKKMIIKPREKRIRQGAGNAPTTPAGEAQQQTPVSRYGCSIASLKNQTSLWNSTAVGAFGSHIFNDAAKTGISKFKAQNQKQTQHMALFSPTLIQPSTNKCAPAVLTGNIQPGRADTSQTAADVHKKNMLDKLLGLVKEQRQLGNDEAHKSKDTPESVMSSHKISPPDSTFDVRPQMSLLLSGQKRNQMISEESVARELFPKHQPLKGTPPEKIVKLPVKNLKSPLAGNSYLSSQNRTNSNQNGKENEMSLFSGLPPLSMTHKNSMGSIHQPSNSEQT